MSTSGERVTAFIRPPRQGMWPKDRPGRKWRVRPARENRLEMIWIGWRGDTYTSPAASVWHNISSLIPLHFLTLSPTFKESPASPVVCLSHPRLAHLASVHRQENPMRNRGIALA